MTTGGSDSPTGGRVPLMDQIVALVNGRSGLAARLRESAARVAPAACGTASADQQEADAEHGYGTDQDAVKEHRARRPDNLEAENRETVGQDMGSPGVGQDACQAYHKSDNEENET